MADGDIKQRIVLTGEKEYSAALKEAQRNLKTLRSELKAETAELGANATAQQKNEVKVKNLQKQIKEQEKVVKTYKAALEEVKEKYGDNEDAIAKWEQKLNDARTALANMKNGLQDVGKGMQTVEGSAERGVVAANSFADSLSKIADVGDSISGAIENSFTTIVGHITDAIGALWDQLMDVAAKANEWGDIAGYWNTSASNIQKWYHAVEGTYNDFGNLSNAVTKIVTADQKKVAEVAGVSAEQYSDKWEYAMAVMDSLSKMGYEKKLEAVGELFGDKRSPIILDLLNDWDKIQKNLADFDATNGGFGLTDEQLEKASTLAEDVAKLKQSWEALKGMASIELFGDLALNITGNLQNIVEAFKEYFQADTPEKKQAAIQKIKDNIIEIFKNIRDAINDGLQLLNDLAEELKNSPDATARALGEILDKIVNALDWFTKPENWEAVKRGFDAIIGVWVGSKVLSAVGSIGSFAASALTIAKFAGLGGAAAAGGAAATGGFGATVSNILTKGATGLGNFLGGVSGMVNSAPYFDWFFHNTNLGRSITGQQTWEETGKAYSDYFSHTFSSENWNNFLDNWNPNSENANPIAKLFRGTGALYNPTTLEEADMRPSYMKGWDNNETYQDWLRKNAAIWEDEDLGGKYSLGDMAEALQDWWDARRNAEAGTDTWEEEASAFEWMKEVFGEDFGDVWDRILAHLDELTSEEQMGLDDIPADWWNGGGTDNGLTSEDISGFRSIPGQMRAAVRDGVSNIRVTMDGYTVGNLVAPYVSEYIARDIIG